MQRLSKIWFLLLATLLVAAGTLRAQDAPAPGFSLLFRDASMQEALKELVDVSGIDLVYTSDLVSGKRVFCSMRKASVDELLRCILRDSGLDYIRSSAGTYVIITALKAASLVGDLAGSITDLDTGAPLPYANVLLADASSGTTTNQDGLFRFPDLVSGMHRLVVTYVGYETRVDTVWIEPGRQNRTWIRLRPNELSVGPIVIDGLEQRLPSGGLGQESVAPERLSLLTAAGTPDVMRGAGRIAGVGIQQPLAALHIQGSAGNEHVTLLDGAPVRNPVSMGRLLGAFSPLALGRLTVHKAGYGVQYGSNLTGYVAVDHDLAASESLSGTVMLDPVSANIRVRGRLRTSGPREGAFMAAVRASNWDVYQDQGVQTLLRHWNAVDPLIASFWARQQVNRNSYNLHSQQPEVAFSDMHLAYRVTLNPYHNLGGSLYRASNRLASDLVAFNQLEGADSDLFMISQDRYIWLNWAAQMRHGWLLGARSALSTQLKGSRHSSAYSYEAARQPIDRNPSAALIDQTVLRWQDSLAQRSGYDEENVIDEITLASTLSHSFSSRHHAEIGLEALYATSRFAFENAYVDRIDYDLSAWQFAGFVQDDIALGTYATLEPGVRVTYLQVRRTLYAEPRLALRIDGFAPEFGDYALRFAGGVYRQFINQFDLTSLGVTSAVPSILFWLPVDRSIAPPRAYHLTADALLMPGETWSIGVETYAKWQPRLLTLDYSILQELDSNGAQFPSTSGQHRFITATSGRSYGGSLQLKREGRRTTSSIQYGYSRSLQRFPGRFDDALLPAPWNTPHRAAVDFQARLADPLRMEINWIGEWGRRWAYRRAYYDFVGPRDLAASYPPFELDSPADDERPAFQQLDLGFSYEVRSGRFASVIQLFVVNVMNRENVYDYTFEPGSSGHSLVPRTLPGRRLSLSVRIDY